MDDSTEHRLYLRPWGLHVVNSDNLRLGVENIKRRTDFMLEQCRLNKTKKILIEAQRTLMDATKEEIAESLQSIKALENAGLQVAIVAPRFIETGITNDIENITALKKVTVKYFQDKISALKWLTADLDKTYTL